METFREQIDRIAINKLKLCEGSGPEADVPRERLASSTEYASPSKDNTVKIAPEAIKGLLRPQSDKHLSLIAPKYGCRTAPQIGPASQTIDTNFLESPRLSRNNCSKIRKSAGKYLVVSCQLTEPFPNCTAKTPCSLYASQSEGGPSLGVSDPPSPIHKETRYAVLLAGTRSGCSEHSKSRSFALSLDLIWCTDRAAVEVS